MTAARGGGLGSARRVERAVGAAAGVAVMVGLGSAVRTEAEG